MLSEILYDVSEKHQLLQNRGWVAWFGHDYWYNIRWWQWALSGTEGSFSFQNFDPFCEMKIHAILCTASLLNWSSHRCWNYQVRRHRSLVGMMIEPKYCCQSSVALDKQDRKKKKNSSKINLFARMMQQKKTKMEKEDSSSNMECVFFLKSFRASNSFAPREQTANIKNRNYLLIWYIWSISSPFFLPIRLIQSFGFVGLWNHKCGIGCLSCQNDSRPGM